MNAPNADSSAKHVLEKVVHSLSSAETLHYEARRLHTKLPFGQEIKQLVTREKYYSWNHAGETRIRVESSASMRGTDISTLFVINNEGVWDAWSNQVCEVSQVFTKDRLLGSFPFFRLCLSVQYPYEIDLQEQVRDAAEYFIVSGKLPDKPEGAPDIASKFVYEIDKRDGLPRSFEETTFGGRLVELRLDKLEINRPMDHGLFEFPSRPRVIATSLNQYLDLRNQEWAKKLLE